MSVLIKTLMGGRTVIFDSGNFDDWCVYVVETSGKRRAYFDYQYFADFQSVSKRYPEDKVYNDFITIYEATSDRIDDEVLSLIDSIVETYEEADRHIMEQWYVVIYGGMVAEENKQFAKLKKRIKRLGMHQILKLNFPAKDAANFSKGQNWRYLDTLMQALGF
jgi:hypothetical protein